MVKCNVEKEANSFPFFTNVKFLPETWINSGWITKDHSVQHAQAWNLCLSAEGGLETAVATPPDQKGVWPLTSCAVAPKETNFLEVGSGAGKPASDPLLLGHGD